MNKKYSRIHEKNSKDQYMSLILKKYFGHMGFLDEALSGRPIVFIFEEISYKDATPTCKSYGTGLLWICLPPYVAVLFIYKSVKLKISLSAGNAIKFTKSVISCANR